MSIIGKFLGIDAENTVEAIGDVIDKVDKSEDKLNLQLKYKELLIGMQEKMVDYENQLLSQQSQIVQSETKGEGWLQRNWRPILMLICIYIIFSNYVLVPYFGIPSVVLDDHIWNLIQIGVSGYVAGRSLEKISDNIGGVLVNATRKDRKK